MAGWVTWWRSGERQPPFIGMGVKEAAGTGGTGAGFPLGVEVAGTGEWRAR